MKATIPYWCHLLIHLNQCRWRGWFLSLETIDTWIVYVCHTEGDYKRFKCLWMGYGSRIQARRFDFKNCNAAGVFHSQQLPMCVTNVPQPKGHPANSTQLREDLESTWASIPVEHIRHIVESLPWRIETVLRAKIGCNSILETCS